MEYNFFNHKFYSFRIFKIENLRYIKLSQSIYIDNQIHNNILILGGPYCHDIVNSLLTALYRKSDANGV